MAFDDAAGSISGCVQRVYRDNMSVKRHFFEKRPNGSSLAILVMKTVTGNGQPRVIRNQSCGFEIVVHPLRFAPRRRLPSAASAEPVLSRGEDQRFSTASIAAWSAISRTRYMTDFDGGSYLFSLRIAPYSELFKLGLVQCPSKLRGPNTGFEASKAGDDDDCKDRCDCVLAAPSAAEIRHS